MSSWHFRQFLPANSTKISIHNRIVITRCSRIISHVAIIPRLTSDKHYLTSIFSCLATVRTLVPIPHFVIIMNMHRGYNRACIYAGSIQTGLHEKCPVRCIIERACCIACSGQNRTVYNHRYHHHHRHRCCCCCCCC